MLVSPGVEVQVIDESHYISGAVGTVPFILMATAQDKASVSSTGVSPGTLKESANYLHLVSSQRELVQLFGAPVFYSTADGTPLNAHELNEYGLMAA
jgi:hypothetical protein